LTNWRMSFRDYANGPSFWPQCRQLGVAAITYKPVADVDFSQHATDTPTPGWAALQAAEKGCLRHFIDDMTPGDVIYVKEGPMIVGKGIVTGPYQFDAAGAILVPNGESPYHHQRRVDWSPEFRPVEILVGQPQITTLLQLGSEDVAAIGELSTTTPDTSEA
jgi:hypothetical protein